jgi:hypothetical protein
MLVFYVSRSIQMFWKTNYNFKQYLKIVLHQANFSNTASMIYMCKEILIMLQMWKVGCTIGWMEVWEHKNCWTGWGEIFHECGLLIRKEFRSKWIFLRQQTKNTTIWRQTIRRYPRRILYVVLYKIGCICFLVWFCLHSRA